MRILRNDVGGCSRIGAVELGLVITMKYMRNLTVN
jgi:hypothetical protein